MMSQIHKSSHISDRVILGNNVKIGPFCNLNGNIKVGDNTEFKSHISITGNTDIGMTEDEGDDCHGRTRYRALTAAHPERHHRGKGRAYVERLADR